MHFVIWVTNTDKVPLEEQMEPFWQDTTDPRYLEKEIMLKGDEESVKKYIDKKLDENEERLKFWKEQSDSKTSESNLDYWQKDQKIWKKIKTLAKKDLEKAKKKIADERYWSIDENGDFYEEYNHNMEWDWYVVGGRWDKYYTTKKNEEVNVFKKSDLDLELTDLNHRGRLAKSYFNQIAQAKAFKWGEKNCIWGYDEIPPLEKYLNDNSKEGFWIPYGYLDDEDWVNENYVDTTDETWEEHFMEWYDGLPDDTEITVVDYHM